MYFKGISIGTRSHSSLGILHHKDRTAIVSRNLFSDTGGILSVLLHAYIIIFHIRSHFFKMRLQMFLYSEITGYFMKITARCL